MEFSSFAELANHEKEAFLKECDLCGRCIEVCQVFPYLEFSDKNPAEFQKELLEVLRGNPASPAVRARAFACSACSSCLRSCPKGLDPHLIKYIIKAEIIARGQKPEGSTSLAGVEGSEYSLQDVLCSLQSKPSDMRWLREVPSDPKRTDLVLFLGCYPYRHPDMMLASLDILEKLDLDFVALVGGPVCCGFKHLAVSADFEKADSSSSALVSSLEAFKPKKVILWCGTCYYFFKELIPRFMSLPFEVQNFGQLLCDNLAKFEFVRPMNKTVTINDSCNLGRRGNDYTSMRRLLSAIPGVNLVEMAHNKENALCCGSGAFSYYPEIARQMKIRRLEEAKSTGADIMASPCPGCHLRFSPNEEDYPFEVKNYVTFFAEALGLNYEDRLKKYLGLHDVDRIMEEAEEYIEESPFTTEQIRSVISPFFNSLWAAK